jgi:hypothetical protein
VNLKNMVVDIWSNSDIGYNYSERIYGLNFHEN